MRLVLGPRGLECALILNLSAATGRFARSHQREIGPHTRETQQGRVRDDKNRHPSRKVTDMEEPRKLYRSRSQRMIAGVCGGLADYFNIDATLVRVLFLLLAVFGGTGLVIYIVMWVIVPDISKV
jgi:phage shock protein C